MRIWLPLFLLVGFAAACNPTTPTPIVPTLATVFPVPTAANLVTEAPPLALTLAVPLALLPTECNAEASIGFAQAQNDLALAAEAIVTTLSSDAAVGAAGQAAFQAAYQQLQAYAIPACLESVRQLALQALQTRADGYAALANGEHETTQARFAQSEALRQQAVDALNTLLASQ